MNAVGIDVSKGKSMIAIMRPFGEIVSFCEVIVAFFLLVIQGALCSKNVADVYDFILPCYDNFKDICTFWR